MAAIVPAPLFFGCSIEAVGIMRKAGMNERAIAEVLIEVRAAAIAEERSRVEWIAMNYPPHAGIRPQDILELLPEHAGRQ